MVTYLIITNLVSVVLCYLFKQETAAALKLAAKGAELAKKATEELEKRNDHRTS